jgi:hypothetical protein
MYLKFAMASERKKAIKEITDKTGVPNDISGIMVDYLGDKSVKCRDFYACHQNMRFKDLAKERVYCRKCTRVCKDETCGSVFTPDHAGSGISDGFCGDCATCCGEIKWDYVCGRCGL